MPDSQPLAWQVKFLEVFNETEKEKLAQRVQDAEEAIFLRVEELKGSVSERERQAMNAAAKHLLTIKTDKLGWPSI